MAESVASTGATQRTRGFRARLDRDGIVAAILLVPSAIGFVLFYVMPAVRGAAISFTDWDLLTEPTNVGFSNYERLLADTDFHNSVWVTFQYVLVNVPLQTFLALLIAVAMDRLTSSITVRGILLLPWLLPNVVVALLWLWMLDPVLGLANEVVGTVAGRSWAFLGSPDGAIGWIAGINIWRHTGYTALLLFAGLQTIGRDVYEAAAMDGASERQMFTRITLPLLRPFLAFVIVTSLVGSFQIFDTVAVTTRGGPASATKVVNWAIYEQAFERFDMGYASAMAMVLFVVLVVVSLVQLKLMRAGEVDQ